MTFQTHRALKYTAMTEYTITVCLQKRVGACLCVKLCDMSIMVLLFVYLCMCVVVDACVCTS